MLNLPRQDKMTMTTTYRPFSGPPKSEKVMINSDTLVWRRLVKTQFFVLLVSFFSLLFSYQYQFIRKSWAPFHLGLYQSPLGIPPFLGNVSCFLGKSYRKSKWNPYKNALFKLQRVIKRTQHFLFLHGTKLKGKRNAEQPRCVSEKQHWSL